jgi:hypothetical protein
MTAELEQLEIMERHCRMDEIELLQEEVEHLLWALETLPTYPEQ